MSRLHSGSRNQHERYAKDRQDYVYGGDDGKVVPMTRYGETFGFRLTPSEPLNDLMSEFLSPEARTKLQLGNQTLKLVSQRHIYVPNESTSLAQELHYYERALRRSSPPILDHRFRLNKDFAPRDDALNEQYSISFKIGIEAAFYSHIFAEPFFSEEEARKHPNYLVFGHVFDYDELADPFTLDQTADKVKEELGKLDPHSTHQFAPQRYSAYGFNVERRTIQ